MRKALAVALVLSLALCGCTGNGIVREDDNAEALDTSSRFITDKESDTFMTVVDSHTGVTYLVWKRGGGEDAIGGITVLLNRDGTPVISEEVN